MHTVTSHLLSMREAWSTVHVLSRLALFSLHACAAYLEVNTIMHKKPSARAYWDPEPGRRKSLRMLRPGLLMQKKE